MSMRHGLETRTPYLYPSVIKLAAKASMGMCMAGSTQNPVQKVAMRHLLARYLPQQHVQAPRKRSEEHTSELQSLMRISYAVFCLKKQKHTENKQRQTRQ